jgi:hypothetical protein
MKIKMLSIYLLMLCIMTLTACSTLKLPIFGDKSINTEVDKGIDKINQAICKGNDQERVYAANKLSRLIKAPVDVKTMCAK